MKYENGDFVKIKTEDEEFIGTIIPRPEILDKNIIVLKLENGYNIGIDKQTIKSVEIQKKYEPIKTEKKKIIFKGL